jgi:hypothetical protein
METVSDIFGVIHGWAGALWIATIAWRKNRRALSISCGLVPAVAFIYGLLNLKSLWAPLLMMAAGAMIVMIA